MIKTVQTDNLQMDYLVFGKGKKNYVILPGLSVHSVMPLAKQIEQSYASFTDIYTIYVFDRAKNIKEGYSVKDMACDTAKAMNFIGLDKADIFGASQGGMIAMQLAIDYPQLVNKMILASTLCEQNKTFANVINKWISLASSKDEFGLLNSFAQSIYSSRTLDLYKDTIVSSNLGILPSEYEKFLILAKACLTFDCKKQLNKIVCPVLVLGSNEDKVVTSQGSKQIAKMLNCQMYLYSDYGHAVYDEAPDFKSRCLNFLVQQL